MDLAAASFITAWYSHRSMDLLMDLAAGQGTESQ